jgi:hypothetical protein
VVDGLRAGSEEQQVARGQGGVGGQRRSSVVLVLRHPRQREAGRGVRVLDQAGAVEPAGFFTAP